MKRVKPNSAIIRRNTTAKGETIEQKIERVTQNGEPISDRAPLTYTEREEGVIPDHDIRADKWEYAIDAMDKVTKSERAKRMNKLNKAKENMEKEKKSQTEKPSSGPLEGQEG